MKKTDDNLQVAPVQPEALVGAATSVCDGRRKLLRGGLLGVPAFLALKSSPVLASNCKLPSGFSASGNLSRTGSNICSQSAPNPSYWRANCPSGSYSSAYVTKRASPYTLQQVKSTHTFTTYLIPASGMTSGYTIAQALAAAGTDEINALIAAALLNAGSGNYPISARDAAIANVRALWTGANGSGYIPNPSNPAIVWGKTEIVQYLKYMMAIPN